MTETQECRTVFSWDTTSVEGATKRIEAHFGRIDAAEKKQASASKSTQEGAAAHAKKSGGHGSGHGPGNVGMGFHDALMGRTSAALFRFTSAAKVGALYATGLGVALEAGGKAFEYARAEMEKTDQAAARLEQSYLKVSKAATFSTVGEGGGKLAGTKEGLAEQIRGEHEQQGDLSDFARMQSSRVAFNGHDATLGGEFYRAYDYARAQITGTQTTGEKMENSELRERVAGQQLGKLNRQITGGLNTEAAAAYDQSRFGDRFAGQRVELRQKEETEVSGLQSAGNGTEENIAAVREKYRLQMDGIDQADKAAQRQLDTEQAITKARQEGGAVELRTAQARLDAAGKALAQTVPGTKGFQAANTAYDAAALDVATTTRDTGMQRADARFAQQMASITPGQNEDERAVRNADLEVQKAREKVRALKEAVGVKATEQELNEANLALITAETSRELQRRRVLEAQIQLENSVRRAPRDVRAAGALLGGASPEEAQTQSLTAGVEAAKDAYDLAVKRAAIEGNSRESLEAQAAAAKDLGQAETSLALHQQQARRERALALEGAQGETASLRFAASGRDDLAEVAGGRAQSRVAIERANLAGHPEMARELAEQQRLRERRSVQDLYLNADGTRRKPGDVQRELFQRRQHQTRVEQFNRAMDRNGGLTDVGRDIGGRITSGVDPLTGNRLNARQIAERNAAANARVDTSKDKTNDSKTYQDILQVLKDRLPQTTV